MEMDIILTQKENLSVNIIQLKTEAPHHNIFQVTNNPLILLSLLVVWKSGNYYLCNAFFLYLQYYVKKTRGRDFDIVHALFSIQTHLVQMCPLHPHCSPVWSLWYHLQSTWQNPYCQINNKIYQYLTKYL